MKTGLRLRSATFFGSPATEDLLSRSGDRFLRKIQEQVLANELFKTGLVQARSLRLLLLDFAFASRIFQGKTGSRAQNQLPRYS